jgi:hypothetical protein
MAPMDSATASAAAAIRSGISSAQLTPMAAVRDGEQQYG